MQIQYLSILVQIGTVRVGAYSNDGGVTFNKVTILNTLIQPLHGCEGSTIYHQSTRQIFYSGLDSTTIRQNLSLHISNDNGENWKFVKNDMGQVHRHIHH